MDLTTAEHDAYLKDGYFVRLNALSAADIAVLNAASEELCRDLAAGSDRNVRLVVSDHYVFEPSPRVNALIKWEPAAGSVIQGVEPLTHLHPTFQRIGSLPALTTPAGELLGETRVELFTEKLNVKRARVGGSFALHRDFPYWRNSAEQPHQLLSVLIALDDATRQNGALEVLPGSHRLDEGIALESDRDFERNEIDPDSMDTSGMITVEIPAGAAIFFGPHLVHRSGPNRSQFDRKVLIYTYQPAGLRDQRENIRRWIETNLDKVLA